MTGIIGGSSHGRGDALIDTAKAVLLDDVHVVLIDALNADGAQRVIGLELGGRRNKSTTRSEVLYLFDEDGVAALISELLGLAGRANFLPELMARIERLDADGDLSP